MSSKVLVTMDYCGNIRVFDMTDDDKARERLEELFRYYQVWESDEEIRVAVRALNWGLLDDMLEDCGFPHPGRDSFVDMEDEIKVETII